MLLINNALIINEGRRFSGHIIVKGDAISSVAEGPYKGEFRGEIIDAGGKMVIPGVVDCHVHFREPGLTHRGDIFTESAAAVSGGVTSFMDMPNTRPATVTLDLLSEKFDLAAAKSLANYSFYIGATNDNIAQIRNVDPRRVCGVKVFMGSSTGNMLVDSQMALQAVFAESPVPVAAHCEDEAIINANMAHYRAIYGDDIPVSLHPMIRSAEACYRSTARAVEFAARYGGDLHVTHISTARELELFDPGPLEGKKVTAEVCVHHLWFTDADYERLGNLVRWNPAVKTEADRRALREALAADRLDLVATDHSPHALEEKQYSYLVAPSGAPSVQHSLVSMLEMAGQGLFSVEKVVDKMCHAPAKRFKVKNRGFLRPGYKADIVIVDSNSPWTVAKENLRYKCGWSPLEGVTFNHKVDTTLVNGRVVYSGGEVDTSSRGSVLEFER